MEEKILIGDTEEMPTFLVEEKLLNCLFFPIYSGGSASGILTA